MSCPDCPSWNSDPATKELGCNGKCWIHCPYGLNVNQELFKSHQISMSDTQRSAFYMKKLNDLSTHARDEHGAQVCMPDKSHKGNGAYQGQFAFTLTKSPDDELTEEDMIKAARKIMSQKSCPVKKYAWYLEYGDPELKLHPHIHGMYETESLGRIEAKHFKRAWKVWDEKHKLGKGFRGGYHRPVRSEEGYSDYIKKDGGTNEYFAIE